MTETEERKSWLGLLAKAPPARLAELWDAAALRPDFVWLRRPEIGAVMVRGRIGASGAAFNMGEMTVTRCSLRLSGGEVGHGYVQGRDKRKAEIAALCDALMQTGAAGRVKNEILEPIAAELAFTRDARARKAAATRVEFFTVARGED